MRLCQVSCFHQDIRRSKASVHAKLRSIGVAILRFAGTLQCKNSVQQYLSSSQVATHRKEGAAVLLDPRLRGDAPLDQVDRVIAIASACVQEEEMLRPTMSDVLRSLENVSHGIHIGRREKIPDSFGSSDPPSPLGEKGNLQLSWQSSGEGSAPFTLGYEMTKLHVGR